MFFKGLVRTMRSPPERSIVRETVRVETAAQVARVARHAGVKQFVHLSGISASEISASRYIRSPW
jgi:hypothetical protein